MSSIGGRVRQIGRMKNNPATPPTEMHKLSAMGTLRVGSATSLAIEETIPIVENVYAVGRRLTKKVKPSQPENEVS